MHFRTSQAMVFALAAALTIAPLGAQGRGKSGGSSKPPHGPSAKPPSAHPSKPPHAGGTKPGKPSAPPESSPAPSRTVAAHLAQKPQLASKLSALLPPGTNLTAASTGFRNLGQFVAAVHVSRNLGIPFEQLRLRMIGPNALSLGRAIQALRPSTNDVQAQVRRAERQADEDLRDRRE